MLKYEQKTFSILFILDYLGSAFFIYISLFEIKESLGVEGGLSRHFIG